MRIIFSIITIFFLNIVSNAQNNFVEVSVIDTVLVPADGFIFHVMAMPEMTTMTTETAPPSRNDYVRRERDMRLQQKQALDAFEVKLRGAGFNPLPASIHDLMMSRGYGNYLLTYAISSTEALIRFKDIVEKEQNINVSLQSATSTQEEAHQKRLLSKLMSKARGKANDLASLSGKKITGIISVTDNAQVDWTGRHPYPTTSVTRSSEQQAVNRNYPVHGKLVVRFAWN